MKTQASQILKVLLVLAGLFLAVLGIDIAFGGIATLGWLGAGDFFSVTDRELFLTQDSHTRFLGGVMLAMAGLFLVAASNLARYEQALKFALLAIFVGGLARFPQLEPKVLLAPDVLGALAAELLLIPTIYVLLSRAMKSLELKREEVT